MGKGEGDGKAFGPVHVKPQGEGRKEGKKGEVRGYVVCEEKELKRRKRERNGRGMRGSVTGVSGMI